MTEEKFDNDYVIVYLDSLKKLRSMMAMGDNLENYQSALRRLERSPILFTKFGISRKQEDLILSDEFEEILDKPFSEIEEKAKSLIDKLREENK